ncbi:methyltransferase, FxLD system [Streptomyces sp. NBC_01803]|uniref:methyltransferase, FxLD system n=1 Tax=Streptomyces sp. NBC_01803 TaxID=2975946 RepID=UPI002DD95B3D|nr:methyltransferase, FxLD system [Streptomyces sp. NBC_01803]WSA44202.1 methyltransferase, FxLD system [Streptomyces sp. NBC_01803]
MTADPDSSPAQADAQREELVEKLVGELVKLGALRSGGVEAAIRAVPRHVFVPEVSLVQAYAAEDAPVVKRDEHGVTISSVSAVRIQALMLEQAGIRPGMRVLEIGSGGYNAALIAELVGAGGEVTTVDIDPDVVGRARRFLTEAGYPQVKVLLGDAEQGVVSEEPFDRIIVTAGAWDIPMAWLGQLAEGGRIVVPLRLRSLTRSIAFDREGDRLVSRSAEVTGFVPMQGAGAYQERLLLLRGKEIGLRFDDGWPANPDLLNGALATERVEAWSGVTIGRAVPYDTLQLWLATALDGYCRLSVDPDLDTGLVAPIFRRSNDAAVDGGNFAYLVARKVSETAYEFGAHAFGSDAATLAGAVAEQVRVWDRAHRTGPGPRVVACPADVPEERLPEGRVVTKRHMRFIISWPATGPSAVRGQDVGHHTTEKE